MDDYEAVGVAEGWIKAETESFRAGLVELPVT